MQQFKTKTAFLALSAVLASITLGSGFVSAGVGDTLTASPSPANTSDLVKPTMTETGAPLSTEVQFFDVTGVASPTCGSGTAIGTAIPSSGVASPASGRQLTAGTHTLLACGLACPAGYTSLGGVECLKAPASFKPPTFDGRSATTTVIVNAPITIASTSTGGASVYGQPFTLTATTTDFVTTDKVDFRYRVGSDPDCSRAAGTTAGGTSLGTQALSGTTGTAAATISVATNSAVFVANATPYHVTACLLNSSGTYQNQSAEVNQTITKAQVSLALTVDHNPSAANQSVTVTATGTAKSPSTATPPFTTATPGTVSFSFSPTGPTCTGGNSNKALAGSGTASCVLATGISANTTITAKYGGTDPNFTVDSTQTSGVSAALVQALAISPTSAQTILPGGTSTVSVTGGTPPFKWTVSGTSGSPTVNDGTTTSATIASTTARSVTYKAGSGSPTGTTADTVTVVDSTGKPLTAQTGSVGFTVGQGLVIAETVVAPNTSKSNPPPGGQITLEAQNGSNSYGAGAWSIVSTLGGSATTKSTLSTTAGGSTTYTAGDDGVTDAITLTDSNNNQTTLKIAVGSALVIQQPDQTVAPSQAFDFSAAGGAGAAALSWTVTEQTAGGGSGFTVTSGTGATFHYVAGHGGAANTHDVVTVTDGLKSASVNVTVTPQLSITYTTLTVAPKGTLSFSAKDGSNDYKSNNAGWSLTATPVGKSPPGPALGSFSTDTTNTFLTYTAGDGSKGSASDDLTLTDSLGNTSKVTITITAVLGATVVDHDPAMTPVPPRGQATITATGGQTPYTYVLTTGASAGLTSPSISPDPAVAIAGSTNYTAGSNGSSAAGNVSDQVTITDANGVSYVVTIPIGFIVTATPNVASTPPKGLLSFGAAGGSGVFTWSLGANASGGTINAATGSYAAGVQGDVTDVVHVVDSLGNFTDVQVGVGDAVAVGATSVVTAPLGTLTLFAEGGSSSGYNYTLDSNASGGSVNASTGVYTAGATGSVTDVVRATDSLGNVSTIRITVTAAITLSPPTVSAAPNEQVMFSAANGSGMNYQYAVVTSGSGGSVDASGVYTAGPQAGTDVVQVTDSFGATAQSTVTVTAGLSVSPASASVAPQQSKLFTATGGKPPYVYQLQNNASGGSVDASGTYHAGKRGGVQDTIRVTDATGGGVNVTVTVTGALTIDPPSGSVAPNGSAGFTASGGGTPYTWSLSKNGSGGHVGSTGFYTAGPTGPSADTVTVTDAFGNTASANVSVGGGLAVSPADPTVAPKGTVAFTVIGGAGGYTWSLTGTSGGTINANSGAYVAGSVGNATDHVTVTDAVGATASVDVHVTGALGITPASSSVAAGAKLAFGANGGSGSYTFAFVTNASGGTIDGASGAYVAGTKGGTDTVRVTDSAGATATATVSVTAAAATTTTTTTTGGAGSSGATGTGGTTGGSADAGTTAAKTSNVDAEDNTSGCSSAPTNGMSGFAAFALGLIGLALVRRRRR